MGWPTCPQGAVVGTSSLRRRAQLLHRRPDLQIVEFRGNVQTRLKKLADGVASCTFLAMAGLNRLGATEVPRRPIEPEEMLPAVAQGAIGIERRPTMPGSRRCWRRSTTARPGLRLAAERAFLARLDGSCQTPIGGLAELDGDRLRLRGEILRPDGSACHADAVTGPASDGAALGRDLADRLLGRAGPGFFG
jgi:hydroxymethylbilane synthase